MFSPTIKYLYESTSARPDTLAQLHVPYHWCYLPINPLSHQFAILTLHVIKPEIGAKMGQKWAKNLLKTLP